MNAKNAMNAIPRVVHGAVVDPTGNYSCPLCKVERVGGDSDIGWVACPMVNNQMICLGSYLDFQDLARSTDFDTDPHFDLFRELAQRTQQTIQALRWTCLRHQLRVIDDNLQNHTPNADLLRNLRERVARVLGTS